MRLSGQVGLVTGAASGIGEAIAKRVAQEGARVVCLDINDPSRVTGEIGDRATPVQLDVTDAVGWAAVVSDTVGARGNVDFLVNVAGIPVMDPDVADTVTTLTEAWWDKVLGTNLKGTWLGMRAVIPHMQKAGGGRIVNTADSSLSGTRGVPTLAAYSASKGGIDALTRQAAAEYAGDGVLINAIAPGTILTPLLAAQPEEWRAGLSEVHMIKRLGETAEIAAMAAYLLAEGSFVTGAVFPVDGGWAAKG